MLAYIIVLNSFTDTEMSDISKDFSPLKLTDYFQK